MAAISSMAVDKEIQLVVFTLYGEEFGVDIMQVKEIIKPQNITRLPHAPEFVAGVINLRGDVIPIVDLRKRFELAKIENTDQTRIIIVEIANGQVGLIVDSVAEVLRIQSSSIGAAPANIAGLKTNLLKGIGKLDDRLLILLDLEELLSTDEKLQLRQVVVSAGGERDEK